MLDHDEIVRLYGPWIAHTPQDVAALFAAYGHPWWIAGGWAIEAFTSVPRPHDDIDPTILRSGIPALREHLSGRLDIWQADDGTLRPIISGTDPVWDSCENLWLRASGADPWEYDVKVIQGTPSTWTYKRDARITRPMEETLWTCEGIPYLRPEVQLLHKAPGLRQKDQADFDACAPLLDRQSRVWLRDALGVAHPGHPWIIEPRPLRESRTLR